MARLKSFKVLDSQIKELKEAYEEAKMENDTQLMEELNNEYLEARNNIVSSYYHLVNLTDEDLQSKFENAKTKEERKQVIAKKHQREIYKKNKSYIKMIKKSKNLNSLANKSQLKSFFNKFKYGLLAVAIVIGGGLGISKLSKNHKNPDKQNIQNEQVDDEIKDNTDSDSNTIKEDTPLLGVDNNQSNVNENINDKDLESNEENKNNNNNVDNSKEPSNSLIPPVGTTTTTKKLNPNVKNDDEIKETEEVIKEKPAKEKKPIPYPIKEEKPETDPNKPVSGEDVKPEDKNPANPINPAEAAGDKVIDDDETIDNDKLQDPAEAAGDKIKEDVEDIPKEETNNVIEKEEINPVNPAEAAGDKVKEDNNSQDIPSSGNNNQKDEIKEIPEEEKNNIIKEEENNIINPAEAAGDNIKENDDMPILYENMNVLEIDEEAYTLSYSNK